MLLALTRRRSLLVGVVVAVAFAAFAVPALAGVHGYCPETTDQHCSPALPPVEPLPLPSRLGFAEPSEITVSPPVVIRSILKIPLAA